MNNTAAQLVKQLGDKREITIMSDVVRGLDFEYNQLKQENEGLVRLLTNKIMLDYDYDSVLKKQLSEERLSYIALSESKHILENILTEFENWLEEKTNYWKQQEEIWVKEGFIKFGGEANNKIIFKSCLDKLQELKGNN